MKDQKTIRLGLIGVGNWALFAHVRVLRLLPEYEIVAIYSQRKEAAMAAATEYGIPHVAESLDALVTDPLVDQVLVLTTSQQHEEGKGLYDDKPQMQRDEAIRSATFGAASLLYAAEVHGFGSCPMIGFDHVAVASEFSLLPDEIPVLLVAIGGAATDNCRKKADAR